MDPYQLIWWMVFGLVLIVDIILWTVGLLLDFGPDGRFRLLVTAAMLLFAVLGMAIGWMWAAIIWFIALWVYAILAGLAEPSTEIRS
jgi:hypothetical protein